MNQLWAQRRADLSRRVRGVFCVIRLGPYVNYKNTRYEFVTPIERLSSKLRFWEGSNFEVLKNQQKCLYKFPSQEKNPTLIKIKVSQSSCFLLDFKRKHHGGGTHVGVEHPPRARQHRPSPLEAVCGSWHGLALCHGSHLHHAHDHECLWELHCHLLIFYVSKSWFLVCVFMLLCLFMTELQ